MYGDNIDLSFSELSDKATEEIKFYCEQSIHHIDTLFGDGYAKKHPELIGRLAQACATEFATSATGKIMQQFNDPLGSIAAAINRIADYMPEGK